MRAIAAGLRPLKCLIAFLIALGVLDINAVIPSGMLQNPSEGREKR